MGVLTELLVEIAELPAEREKLLPHLLTAEVYCLGEVDDADAEHADMHLLEWEDPRGHRFIPCFSSMDALSESVEEDTPYLVLMGRDLFELISSEMVIIDPELETECVLSPDDLHKILNG